MLFRSVAVADLEVDLEVGVATAEALAAVAASAVAVALLEAVADMLAELVLAVSAVAKVVSTSQLLHLLHQTRSPTLQRPTARPLTPSTFET